MKKGVFLSPNKKTNPLPKHLEKEKNAIQDLRYSNVLPEPPLTEQFPTFQLAPEPISSQIVGQIEQSHIIAQYDLSVCIKPVVPDNQESIEGSKIIENGQRKDNQSESSKSEIFLDQEEAPDIDQFFRETAQKSIGIFGRESRLRQTLFRLFYSKSIRMILLLFTITEVVGFLITDYSYRSYHTNKYNIKINIVSDIIQLICNLVFFIEFIIGIIVLGFFEGANSYIRNFWNSSLLLILISGIISRFVDIQAINIVKYFRILTFFRHFPELQKKVNAFFGSFKHLGKTFFPLFCMVLLYAIVGMSFFHGHIESRCRLTPLPRVDGTWEIDEKIELPCGGMECPEGTYCGNPNDYNLHFNHQEANTEKLLFGFNIFNRIDSAMFSAYNFLMVTGWIQTTYIYWRAQEQAVTAIYFVSLVLFLSQVISNIILATLYEGFIDETSIKHQNQKKTKSKQNSQKDISQRNIKQTATVLNIDRISNSSVNQRIGLNPNNNLKLKSLKNITSINIQELASLVHLPGEKSPQTKFSIKINRNSSISEIKTEGEKITLISKLVNSNFAQALFSINIILGIIVLCLDNHYIEKQRLRILNILDFISFVILMIEIVFTVWGIGLKLFIKDNLHILDLFIFTLHIISYANELTKSEDIFMPLYDGYILIRCTKMLRGFKILYHYEIFESIKVVLKTYYFTLKSIPEYLIVFLVIAVLFAQIGREIFAYTQPHENHHILRINYNTLSDSVIAIAMIFYNEEWHISMYMHMEFVGVRSVFFHLICMLICQVLYVRLFIAIFISQFMKWLRIHEKEFDQNKHKIGTLEVILNRFLSSISSLFSSQASTQIHKVIPHHSGKQIPIQIKVENLDFPADDKSSNSQLANLNSNSMYLKSTTQKHQQGSKIDQRKDSSIFINQDSQTERILQQKQNSCSILPIQFPFSMNIDQTIIQEEQQQPEEVLVKSNHLQLLKQQQQYDNNNLRYGKTLSNALNDSDKKLSTGFEDKSLNLFSQSNYFRRICTKIVFHTRFDIFMVVSIIMFAVIITLDSPFLNPNSNKKYFIIIFEFIHLVIFILENIMQIIARGAFFNGPNSYFKQIFNIVDFLTTLMLLLYLLNLSKKSTYVANFFMIFRVFLLPTFLAKYNHDIQLAGKLLVYCSSRMMKLFFFAVMFLLMNGIITSKLLKDSMWKCEQMFDQSNTEADVSKWDCLDLGGDWIESEYNFNSIISSILILFMVQSSEGWLFIMQDTFDSTTSDQQLHYKQRSLWAIFYIQFFFIANICILNMFVGLVVESLLELIENESGTHALTPQQKEWYFIKKSINHLVPTKQVPTIHLTQYICEFKLFYYYQEKQPGTVIGNWVFRHTVTNKALTWFFDFFTVANTVSFMLFHNRISDTFKSSLNVINCVCLSVMAIEMVSRLITQHMMYLQSKRNLLDFIILGMGIVNLYYQFTQDIKTFSSYYRIFEGIAKGFQVIRLYRVFSHFLIIRKLFKSLSYALSSILGVSIILVIYLYTSVLLVMNLFPYLKGQETVNDYEINFRNFFSALFSLIRIVTLEMWYLIPSEAAHQKSPNFVCRDDMYDYEDYQKYGLVSCGSPVSYVFFYSFFLIFTLIILNLFIATIIESYKEAFSADESAINHYQLGDVLNLWTKFDPDGKGHINYKEFWQFSSQIAIIYGVDSEEFLNVENKSKFLKSLDIPMFEDPLHKIFCYKFHDVIIGLSKISVKIKYGVSNLEPDNFVLREELNKRIQAKSINSDGLIKKTPLTSSDMSIIIVLTRKVKQWRNKLLNKGNQITPIINVFDLKNLAQKIRTFTEKEENLKNK